MTWQDITIERLGLPADSSDETTIRVLEERLSQTEVAAAIDDGKILAAHKDYWVNAWKADFEGTRQILASLAQPQSPPPVNAVAAASQVSLPGPPPRPAPRAKPGTDTFATSATTYDDLIASIEADPEMHRAVFEISGGGGGLKPPPERIFIGPDVEAPWNPKPQIVLHEDGTGHWETPQPRFE